MASRPPHPALRGAVHRYVGFSERSAAPVRRLEVPQDRVTVILGFGPPLTVGGPRLTAAARGSFVAPLGDSYAVTEFQGASHGIQVDLSPLAARALLGVPMRELDALVDLDDVLGPEASRLVERLADAPGWDARFDVLDRAIGRRLEEAARPSPDAEWAWRLLHEAGGGLRIGELAAELRCSRRHLAAVFRDHVGPPPKTVARIMRFRRVLGHLERDPGGLAAIAQACGYADQPHLNRDFRELAGTTPTAYVASRMPDGLGVRASVTFVQDAVGARA